MTDETSEESDEVYKEVKEQENVKPVEDVAREVIAGHWGTGKVRKQRLKDAGWDPDAVQKEVTRIFNQG